MTPAELRAATRQAIEHFTGKQSVVAWDHIEAAIDAEIAAAKEAGYHDGFKDGYEQRGLSAALPQWQPIETAPKDESAITGGCWAGSRWLCTSVFWHRDYPGWYLAYVGLSRDRIPFEPTHWMPLPAPPEPSK